ncbi:MAG: hypothetical protein N2745_04055 [Syntrophorhabdaceae bacterium]|nr:hypothetical protein [Syntrophorhabdaceae bacterium]
MRSDRGKTVFILLFVYFLFITIVLPLYGKEIDTLKKRNVDYAKEIKKRGNVTIVSKTLAEQVKADNTLITAYMAVKASRDTKGRQNGFRIVEVDKGSLPERLGVKVNDIFQEVNGYKLYSEEDVKRAEAALRDETNFRLKILRGGKARTLYFEIR